MIHLAAVFLTFIPGFGLGYLLLGRIRAFAVHYLVCALLASFIALFRLDMMPVPAAIVFAIGPLLVWNVYHAHRLWLEGTAEDDNGDPQKPDSFFYRLAPFSVMGILALGILLGILSIPWWFSEEQPKDEWELRREGILERLDNHQLSYKARLYNPGAEEFFYWYDVEPGGYTVELYMLHKSAYLQIPNHALRIERHTEDFVYVQGYEVYVLNTNNRDDVDRFVDDLMEERGVNCEDTEEVGVCGYEP